MDFTLSPEIEDLRLRTRAFVAEHVLPLERDPENFSEHENIPGERLEPVRAKAKAAGLWAPQSPKEFGGMALPIVAWAAMYEEAARSLFGQLAFNCMAPDDGNMNLLARAGNAPWIKAVKDGLVPVTVGLILASGVVMARAAANDFLAAAIAVATAIFIAVTNRNPLWMLGAGTLASLVGAHI